MGRYTIKTSMKDYALDCDCNSNIELLTQKALNKLGKLEDLGDLIGYDIYEWLLKHRLYLISEIDKETDKDLKIYKLETLKEIKNEIRNIKQ